MARRNILIRQGATWRLVFRIEDDGVPRDLTGYQARMKMRAAYDSPASMLNLDTYPGGGITLEPLDGRVILEAAATTTDKYAAPAANVYDIELEAPDGTVERVLEGVARVTPEATY